MEDQYIGKKCSFQYCRQIDWIPLLCKYCQKYYCAQHHTINTHLCPEIQKKFKKVYSCPLCQKTILINSALSVQQSFQIHEAIDCTRFCIKKKMICQRAKCNKKITQLNKFICNSCNSILCLKHRSAQDHFCKNNKQNKYELRMEKQNDWERCGEIMKEYCK